MYKGFLLTALFILCISQFGISQDHNSNKVYDHIQSLEAEFTKDSRPLFSINRNADAPSNAHLYVKKAEYLSLDNSYVEQIQKDRPGTLLLDLPIDGRTYRVQLYKKEVTTSTYQVKSASGVPTQKTKSVFYRGIIKGEKSSFVSFAVLNNSIHITMSYESENYEINKIDADIYAAYKVSDSKHTQDTGCSTSDLHHNKNVKIKKNEENRSTGDCIEIYIECDFDSYQKNGFSIQNTEDWALAIMNEVGILFENEGVPLVVSDILVYDVADPYLGGSTAGQMLDFMGGAVGDYDGRLAHVFSTRSVGGGVAYLDVLCANNNGFFGPFAVSGSMNTNTVPFPIYSWNVNVVAHELGHNVGSRHTHDCVWNGDNTQIDDCGPEAGYNTNCSDPANPILPSSGTIMSYCHIVGGIGISFNNGFGPQPGALLLDKYLSANCVTGDDCFGGGGAAPEADFTFTQFNPCNPSEVQFTDLSSNAPTLYEWELPGGTPSFSTQQNPFIVYTEPGFYDVSLTVTNADGSDDLTLIQVIEVLESPVPDFTYELIEGAIAFTNQTNVPVDSYFWDFGDGDASGVENPEHIYAEDGIYTVTLTVTNVQCGMVTIQKVIDVYLPPTADFSIDTMMGCVPLTIDFLNNSSENSESFLWTFEGGTPETSTQENPTVVYDEPGIYDVKLIVMNDVGDDTKIETSLITIEEAPTADFMMDVDSLVVDFENLSAGYETLLWAFGDGNSSTLTNPTHTYDTEGAYEVILTVMNDCDTITMVQSINLTTLPIAGYNADVTEGCLPLTIIYTNSSSANASEWLWSFPGGTPSTSTEENPSVVYETVGDYNVMLKVVNEVGEDSIMSEGLISILDVPNIAFDYSQVDFEVDFTDQSSDYDYLSWNFGDGNMSAEENPMHTYTEDGMYEVTLSATNTCGTVTISKTVIISTLPVADYSATITQGCIPMTIEFSDNSSTNVQSWLWSFPGGTPSTSTDKNPSVSYIEEGTFDVTLIVNSAAGPDTLYQEDYIFTQDVPNADFGFSPQSEFEYSFNNTSSNADSYVWDFGDGNTSTEDNPEHTYAEPGTYKVILSATNLCGTTTSEEEIIIINTSIDRVGIFGGVDINPNPNNGDFILSMDVEVGGELQIDVYNILGQKVESENLLIGPGQNDLAIRLNNQTPGAYLMMIRKGDQNRVLKFLIH